MTIPMDVRIAEMRKLLVQMTEEIGDWRSQDSVDTLFPAFVSSFELIRADTADVAMPA